MLGIRCCGQYGAAGFSFDGVFIGDSNKHNSTSYSQWQGWMTVLAGLRTLHPEIVIDNRLSAHAYGPWYQLAGSYSEPIAGDENPETYGIPVPSLKTDHVAADNMRRVNLWYRNTALFPMERIPGFAFHQTERSEPPVDTQVDVCSNSSSATGRQGCYKRDFDLLGFRYSIISQVATAGLNNVMCMLPARDEKEFELFPSEDVAFIVDWLKFTDANIPALQNTVPVPGHDAVLLGAIDATAALVQPLSCVSANPGDGTLGYVFLFNPGYANNSLTFVLDDTLSPSDPCTYRAVAPRSQTPELAIAVSEIYPFPKPVSAGTKYGGSVTVDIDGASCMVLKLERVAAAAATTAAAALHSSTAGTASAAAASSPVLVGVQHTHVVIEGPVLVVSGARGERGRSYTATVGLERRLACSLKRVEFRQSAGSSATAVSGELDVASLGCGPGRPQAITTTADLRMQVTFGGVLFPRSKQVALAPGIVGPDGNTSFAAEVAIPAAVLEQLKAREKAYPVPWTKQDHDASWLLPHRLLLFLQLNCTSSRAGACDDTMFASLVVDGKSVPNLMAYESRCTECNSVNHPTQRRPSHRFNGYYWDVSELAADEAHRLKLTMPSASTAVLAGLFFDNVETITTDRVAGVSVE